MKFEWKLGGWKVHFSHYFIPLMLLKCAYVAIMSALFYQFFCWQVTEGRTTLKQGLKFENSSVVIRKWGTKVKFDWIGGQDPKIKKGTNLGVSGDNQTLDLLLMKCKSSNQRANPVGLNNNHIMMMKANWNQAMLSHPEKYPEFDNKQDLFWFRHHKFKIML